MLKKRFWIDFITCLTFVLLTLSLASFGLVYALNGHGAKEAGVLQEFIAPIVNDSTLTAVEEAAGKVQPAKARVSVFKSEEVKDGVIRRTLVLNRGETLTSRLIAAGVTRTEVLRAMEALRGQLNPSSLKGGQNVVVLFNKTPEGGEIFAGFELRTQPTRLITVARASADSFKGQSKDVELQKLRLAVRGVVDENIYDSGIKAGIPVSVLTTLIKNYSYNLDFQREVKPGDRFEVLYEQAADENGKGVGGTTLIYAALQVGGRIMPIYRVAMPGGVFEYFDAKGESIRKGLLRTPVEGARITSGFGMRLHPIMGYSRMHKGIDFGAPPGTPIYAAGSGVVEEAGWKSGFGKYVRVRHNGKIATAYGHMSNYGRGITKGTRVAQGQIIGYVGSTGASTGPHLHYEILVNNEQVNPLTVAVNTATTLGGQQLAAFQNWRGKVHGQFEQLIAAAESGTRTASVAENTKTAK